MACKKFSLRRHNFDKTSGKAIASLYKDDTFADVTLVSEDNLLVSGHKIILASGSPFLRKLFNENRNKFLLQVSGCYQDLCLIVQYIYTGSCEVENGDLDRFLTTAKELEIYGLYSDIIDNKNSDKIESSLVQDGQSLEMLYATNKGEYDDTTIDKNTEMVMNEKVVEDVIINSYNDLNNENFCNDEEISEDNTMDLYEKHIDDDTIENTNEEIGMDMKDSATNFNHIVATNVIEIDPLSDPVQSENHSILDSSTLGNDSNTYTSNVNQFKDKRFTQTEVTQSINEMKYIQSSNYKTQTESESNQSLSLDENNGSNESNGSNNDTASKNTQNNNYDNELNERPKMKNEWMESKLSECYYCQNKYSSKYRLFLHLKSKHNVNSFNCDICGIEFPKPLHLLQHKKNIHSFKYRCIIEGCNYETVIERNISRHNMIKHKNNSKYEGKMHMCEQCGMAFNQKISLRKHIDNKCVRYIKKKRNDIDNTYMVQCDLCHEEFRNQYTLLKHKDKCHDVSYKCSWEGCTFKNIRKPDLMKHYNINHLKVRYPCETCGYQASTRGNLKQHSNRKHGVSVFECNECGKAFTTSVALVRHTRFIHEGVRIKCNIDNCDYQCSTKIIMKCHIEDIHQGIRYTCNFPGCGHVTTRKLNLKRHMIRNHEDKKLIQ